VILEKDVSETDRFGRLLRSVWMQDGTLFNERLVRDGYAQVSTFPPDVKYVPIYTASQRSASRPPR
jgi:micrococcal nuclease